MNKNIMFELELISVKYLLMVVILDLFLVHWEEYDLALYITLPALPITFFWMIRSWFIKN